MAVDNSQTLMDKREDDDDDDEDDDEDDEDGDDDGVKTLDPCFFIR